MISLSKRLDLLEASLVKIQTLLDKNPSTDEIHEVVTDLFDQLEEFKDRIDALENTLDQVETILKSHSRYNQVRL